MRKCIDLKYHNNLQFDNNGILRNKSDTLDIPSSCKTTYCNLAKSYSRFEFKLDNEKNGKYLKKDYINWDPNKEDGYFELKKK